MQEKVIIMGAAGRDFHNFNVYFRDNVRYHVVGFTATQIPNIEGRLYPPEFSGKLYPNGIPIYPDKELRTLIKEQQVDMVAFSYSDVPHEEVMHKASLVTACGADFVIIGATYTMLRSEKKVVAVSAVRTGSGKSQTSRQVCRIIQKRGQDVVVVRHPMPYGDLTRQEVQRFSSMEDLGANECTIEEREEYEPWIQMGIVVYAGVDYGKILREAEKEADIVVWDGGNNDTPFFYPDVHIVIFDPHRPGHEKKYHPGETNMLMADIAVVNKVDSAEETHVKEVVRTIKENNPEADIVLAESEIQVEDPHILEGKRVLVIEDGPTLTHGEMPFGAGVLAARRGRAKEIVDPRPAAVGSLRRVFETYPHIGAVLPAMGYGREQVRDLEETINNTDCDLVAFATPIDLRRVIRVDKPTVRVRYEYKDHGEPFLESALMKRLGA